MDKNHFKHKISKYTYKYVISNDQKKKIIYAKKINYYLNSNSNLINRTISIQKNLIGGYDYTDVSDVIKYIDCKINNKNCSKHEKGDKIFSNTQPYVLVVYGPPASGKSKAKKLMIEEFNLTNNYINIDVDQFVYDTNQFQNYKNSTNISDLETITSNDLDSNPKVLKIIENYKNIRSKTSFLIKIFIGIALMFNYNVVLETTGGGSDWSNITDELLNNKYHLFLIYPYTNNIDLLIDRSIKRGLIEHRFVTKKYFYEIFKKSQKNFLRVLEPNNINKFKAIYVYKTDLLEINDLSDKNAVLFKYVNIDGKVITNDNNDQFIDKLKSID